jgi:outer membrane protein assembly factor BamA
MISAFIRRLENWSQISSGIECVEIHIGADVSSRRPTMVRPAIRAFVVFALIVSVVACTAVAQAPLIISRIIVVGNRRVNRDTTLALIHTRVGDPYNPKILLDDVETLEHSKYFEGVQFGIVDDPDPNLPTAKVISFYLRERPVIDRIEYNGLESLNPSEIPERFKSRNVDLSVGGFFNPEALNAAQMTIREMLAERGHPSAQLKFSFQSIPRENAVNITFTVDEGPAASH